jgi:uncharacterized protein with HEPN domain
MLAEDIVRLRHMVDACELVARFIEGRNRADLDTDLQLLYALVRAMEVIGEAASRMSDPGRARIDGVPWSAIISMRNRLIHGYFDVDPDIVWTTATVEIPALRSTLDAASLG